MLDIAKIGMEVWNFRPVLPIHWPSLSIERIQKPVGWGTDNQRMVSVIPEATLKDSLGIAYEVCFPGIGIIRDGIGGMEERAGCSKRPLGKKEFTEAAFEGQAIPGDISDIQETETADNIQIEQHPPKQGHVSRHPSDADFEERPDLF